jgi:mono/diheme cytochrome c family protein
VPSSTTYPLDIFPEMHYSPAFGRLEPPRLDMPAGAVPVTGRAPAVSFADVPSLQSPLEIAAPDAQRGADLYRVNCQVCHGPQGRGDGFVAGYFRAATWPRPPI